MELFRYITIVGLLGVLGFGLYWVKIYQNKSKRLQAIIGELLDCNSEMKHTLLQGLVTRFTNADDGDEESLKFQRFVAKIYRNFHGGKTSVTRANAELGIDIEYSANDKLYLGQVKCYPPEDKVGFEPVALIHSLMLKRSAQGGFIVTTSSFTNKAQKYAQGLGIELINGTDFIDMWATTQQRQRAAKDPEELKPQQA